MKRIRALWYRRPNRFVGTLFAAVSAGALLYMERCLQPGTTAYQLMAGAGLIGAIGAYLMFMLLEGLFSLEDQHPLGRDGSD